MKKFKLLPVLMFVSALTLSGCAIGGTTSTSRRKSHATASGTTPSTTGESDPTSSGSTDSEDPSTNPTDSGSPTGTTTATGTTGTTTNTGTTQPGPSGITAWPAAVKEEMNYYLGEELPVLPLNESTLYYGYESDYDCYVVGDDNETNVVSDYGTKLVAAGYTAMVDDYGDPVYVKEKEEITIGVYFDYYEATSEYEAGNEIQAYITQNQDITTDTDWNAEVKAALNEVLGEEIPFVALGENYGSYIYNDFCVSISDGYPEDLTASIIEALTGAGYEYVAPENDTERGRYVKVNEDTSSISIDVYYGDYGNEIDAYFVPVESNAATWADITPLAGFEATLGRAIPSFEGPSYVYYMNKAETSLYIESAVSEDLTSTYETALGAAGFLYSQGASQDWYGKLTISYEAFGEEDSETGELTTVEGFGISISPMETEGVEWSENWPATAVADFLAEFEVVCDVPAMTNSTGYDFRYQLYTYDEAYAEYYEELEMYNAIYAAFGLDEYILSEAEMAAQSAEYAADAAGLYIQLIDAESNLDGAYRAIFGEGWTEEAVEGDSGNYYYEVNEEAGVTICTWTSGGIFTAQVLYPATPTPPQPSEPVTVETTMGDYAAANGWANSEQHLSFALDEVVTITATSGANNGKYYDTSDPHEWRIYHSEEGSFTVSVAAGYELQSITVTYKSQNSGGLEYNGSAVTSGTAVAVSGSSATFTATGGSNDAGTNGQARVQAISVTYAAV